MILCDTALYTFQFLRIAKSDPKCDKWLDIAKHARYRSQMARYSQIC